MLHVFGFCFGGFFLLGELEQILSINSYQVSAFLFLVRL